MEMKVPTANKVHLIARYHWCNKHILKIFYDSVQRWTDVKCFMFNRKSIKKNY